MSAEPSAMRVVLACDFFMRYSSGLATGLSAQGAEVVLLGRDHDLEFGGAPGASAAYVRDAVGDSIEHHSLPGRVRSRQGLAEARRLRRRLRRFEADVVHVQSSITNDPRLVYAAGLRPRRFALTIHNPTPHPGESVSRFDRAMNTVLARAAGLIFVHGEALREEVAAHLGTTAPIVVVPHGVDPIAATEQPSDPSILFFGRITDYKGLDVLLDAMPEVWREIPAAKLTIAGRGAVGEHPALGDSRVRVRDGYVADEEVPGLFDEASLVVLPYRKASQSGVGSLAKQHGRPLVVTSVGGLPELVADGSGLVAPPGDPAALASTLSSVLADRRLAEGLARAALRTATREASWEAVGELTLRAYREHLVPAAGG